MILRILLKTIIFFLLFNYTLNSRESIKRHPWPIKGSIKIGNLFHTPISSEVNYFHHAIDILAPPNTPVYSMTSGYVKLVQDQDDISFRTGLVIYGDDHLIWVVLHLNPDSIPSKIRTFSKDKIYFKKGEFIGRVSGEMPDFSHIHVELWKNGLLINPMPYLEELDDFDPPTIKDVYFRMHNTNDYFHKKNNQYILSGKVDIIAHIIDMIPPSPYMLTPYKISFTIQRIESNKKYYICNVTSFQFDKLPGVKNIKPMDDYKIDPLIIFIQGDIKKVFNFKRPQKTVNNFKRTNRKFYYNLINKNYGFIEKGKDYWDTRSKNIKGEYKFPDGNYEITIKAVDDSENEISKNFKIKIANNSY